MMRRKGVVSFRPLLGIIIAIKADATTDTNEEHDCTMLIEIRLIDFTTDFKDE